MQEFVVPAGKVGGGGVEVAWGKVDCQYRIADCDWQGDPLWSPGRIGSHGGACRCINDAALRFLLLKFR